MARPFDDADVPHSQESRAGWVYAFSHPEMLSLKIGATRKHPIQRATELSAGTGVPGMFTVAYYRWFNDCFEAESTIHETLAEARVDPAREFFKVAVGHAVELIRQLGEERGGAAREGGEWVERGGDMDGAVIERALPWSALFSSFDPNGPDELTPAEQAQCRALEARLR